MAARFSGPGQAWEGLARRTPRGGEWTGKVVEVERHLLDPLRWREARKVFVNSMSDVFHEALPDVVVARVFAVMAECEALGKGHVFQVLTKRPERMARLLGDERFYSLVEEELAALRSHRKKPGSGEMEWPLPNVWLGTSVEDNRVAARVRYLKATPAAIRFLSVEPMIGALDLEPYMENGGGDRLLGIDWVICGGESGHGARRLDLAWVADLYEGVEGSGAAWFWKQTGSVLAKEWRLRNSKGEDVEEVVAAADSHGIEVPPGMFQRRYPGASF